MHIDQAVILCGGLGSRLRELTVNTPKPLLPIKGRPFLEILIQELTRYGIKNILLLASYKSDKIDSFAAELSFKLKTTLNVQVSVEPERAGTGGALYYAKEQLSDTFFMLNGDSMFDVDMFALAKLLGEAPQAKAAVALRPMPDAGRYDVVSLHGNSVDRFGGASTLKQKALINGGFYVMRKSIVSDLTPMSSLERDILPKLARHGQLLGAPTDSFFIDIGVPADYTAAQEKIPKFRRRPAAFLDRDGVINKDLGHVGSIDRLHWIDGTVEAIRFLNASGFYVFVVTNQAGIAKGHYSETDYLSLRQYIRLFLNERGARIDDERYCPYHPDASIELYRRDSRWRKPAPGMLLDLIDTWPIDLTSSFLIGDKMTDIMAAEAAGITGYLFEGGSLDEFVRLCVSK